MHEQASTFFDGGDNICKYSDKQVSKQMKNEEMYDKWLCTFLYDSKDIYIGRQEIRLYNWKSQPLKCYFNRYLYFYLYLCTY